MAHLYVYRPNATATLEARERFEAVLAEDCRSLTNICGVSFQFRLKHVGEVLLGQVTYPSGLKGWTDWHEGSQGGLAWAGVCEDYLGVPMDDATQHRIFRTMEQGGEALGSLTGRFVALGWDSPRERILLATATAEVPSFWETSGPRGWAMGNRATVLLKLVGLTAAIDPESALEYLAFGHLFRPHSLFTGLKRIRARTRVSIDHGQIPRIQSYWPLSDVLDVRPAEGLTVETINAGALHLTARLRRQVDHSDSPQCLITGGIDSRCVAAALVAMGYKGTAQTSGALGTGDVIVGRRVAKRLGLQHEFLQSSPVSALGQSETRLLDWFRVTEGLDVIRHAVNSHGFFERRAGDHIKPVQVFHGLNPIGGGTFTSAAGLDHLASDAERLDVFIRRQLPPELGERPAFSRMVKEIVDEAVADLDIATSDFDQFLQIFYWQRRSLQCFGDLLSAKDFWTHHWTPLAGLHFVRAGLRAFPSERFARKLTARITDEHAPGLKDLKYLKELEKARGAQKLLWKGYKVVMGYHERFPYLGVRRCSAIPRDQSLIDFWNRTLFEDRDRYWRELIDPSLLANLVRTNPLSEVLWRAVTVEMARKACCS